MVPARRRHLKAIVYVANGIVVRIRAIDPDGKWEDDDRGYAAVPVGPPLTNDEIAEQLPGLSLRAAARARQAPRVPHALTCSPGPMVGPGTGLTRRCLFR
ncbi:hypothetical protein MRI28_04245 [Nocardiopsis dassonvillei]|uniref:hypothetical protein n=1 Tax=Nocardiopsis dassonvillei TaxID=2014 RepID=UPI00200E9952|nr:hypothetical protein [Nocardiopsis dassonvillei]MCK9868867.1 hypothetical protein [Nocardiopsis dassonvillei]